MLRKSCFNIIWFVTTVTLLGRNWTHQSEPCSRFAGEFGWIYCNRSIKHSFILLDSTTKLWCQNDIFQLLSFILIFATVLFHMAISYLSHISVVCRRCRRRRKVLVLIALFFLVVWCCQYVDYIVKFCLDIVRSETF